jgi:hypothetical protein
MRGRTCPVSRGPCALGRAPDRAAKANERGRGAVSIGGRDRRSKGASAPFEPWISLGFSAQTPTFGTPWEARLLTETYTLRKLAAPLRPRATTPAPRRSVIRKVAERDRDHANNSHASQARSSGEPAPTVGPSRRSRVRTEGPDHSREAGAQETAPSRAASSRVERKAERAPAPVQARSPAKSSEHRRSRAFPRSGSAGNRSGGVRRVR